jgi:hypothetical protein
VEELTEFERALLNKLVAGDDPALNVLRQQVDAALVWERKWYGGAGFVSELVVDLAAPWFGLEINFEISDVIAKVRGMRQPTIYVVFVRTGRISALEGSTFEDEPWPNPITDFKLSYQHEPRDLRLPSPAHA